MSEIELKQLPINDEFGQCMRKLRKTSIEFTLQRQEEIRRCNHLFVKLKEGEEYFGIHSTDYCRTAHDVECVHCGLTNKFIKIEEIIEAKDFDFYLSGHNSQTIETQMFKEIFKKSYVRGGKTFCNSNINLISDECLKTCHPNLLYLLAIQINPYGSYQEIFEIMKKLNLLETPQEQIRLQTVEQAKDLIERYYESLKQQNELSPLLRKGRVLLKN